MPSIPLFEPFGLRSDSSLLVGDLLRFELQFACRALTGLRTVAPQLLFERTELLSSARALFGGGIGVVALAARPAVRICSTRIRPFRRCSQPADRPPCDWPCCPLDCDVDADPARSAAL